MEGRRFSPTEAEFDSVVIDMTTHAYMMRQSGSHYLQVASIGDGSKYRPALCWTTNNYRALYNVPECAWELISNLFKMKIPLTLRRVIEISEIDFETHGGDPID